MAFKIRKGNEADRTSITPAEAEPIYTVDGKELFIGDGVTPGGRRVLGDAPADGQWYIRQDSGWVALDLSGKVEEAPSDGVGYLRKDASWEPLPTDLVRDSDIGSMASVDDAPADGEPYVRRDEAWEAMPEILTREEIEEIARMQAIIFG